MFLFLATLACGGGGGDQPAAEEARSGPVVVNLRAPQRPDGAEVLQVGDNAAAVLAAAVPSLESVSVEVAALAAGVLNATTAPCDPCMTDGVSSADCLLDLPESCSDLPAYAAWVVVKAAELSDPEELRRAVTITEPWQSLHPAGDELLGTRSAEVIEVVVALDLTDPFAPPFLEQWGEVEQQLGGKVELKLLHTIDEREGVAEAASVIALRGAPWRSIVEAQPISSLDDLSSFSIEGGLDETAARELLDAHLAFVEGLGGATTPTVWIDGYRLSGARGAAAMNAAVERAIALREVR